ncbi:MAG: hypothetical protein ABWZ16_08875, partial [Microbacterium sp.]
ILMLLAAFGFVPAFVGAWLQEAVDVIVILWALRATRTPSRQPTVPAGPTTLEREPGVGHR